MVTRIDIDGVDRVGKDTLIKYIDLLSNHKYILNGRGLLSQLSYNDIYNRGVDYSNVIKDYKNTLVIYLYADIKDLQIRSKITNEPPRDYERDLKYFKDNVKILKYNGIDILEYNTSISTPYTIATDVLYRLDGGIFKC